MSELGAVLGQLRERRNHLAIEMRQLDHAINALSKVSGGVQKRRNGAQAPRRILSPSARRRIAAAQRARWAKVRGNSTQNVVTIPKKKVMSAAARRKIAAAQRARWAKVKASQKKSA
jgi:hypothetical protein